MNIVYILLLCIVSHRVSVTATDDQNLYITVSRYYRNGTGRRNRINNCVFDMADRISYFIFSAAYTVGNDFGNIKVLVANLERCKNLIFICIVKNGVYSGYILRYVVSCLIGIAFFNLSEQRH